jgi:hypothetical protein
MVLYESGRLVPHIYFPTEGIVSLSYVLDSGASAELALVGNDGAVGVSLFMGGETTTSRAVVQSAGHAYRLSGSRLKREFSLHGDLMYVLLRYTQSLLTQWRRQRYAIAITASISNCADCCCFRSTDSRRTRS